MNSVVLVIIYNHQYNKNITILEKIYGSRFRNIFHLVPFYNGEQSNVIPVYDTSYNFEGYVAQGFKSYHRPEFDHYFFIADDMIIHPSINDQNYSSHLRLNKESCFIPRLSSIDEANVYWPWNHHAVSYNRSRPGTEAVNQLPTFETATALVEGFGVQNRSIPFEHLWKKPEGLRLWLRACRRDSKNVLRFIKNRILPKKYHLTYPLVRSYSDIFVVSRNNIKQFCHYCGVFAATNLFVELAIPTAMVFSAKAIVTENDIAFRGKALWTKEDLSILDKYDFKLNELLNNFPNDHLYLHPIKLSKWKI
jgi:hypothetical protein